MKFLIVLSLCAIACDALVRDPEVELPEELKICSRDDPDRNQCIKESIQKFLPSLHKGVPSLGFESLDPLVIENFSTSFKRNQFSGSLSLKNTKTYGMTRCIINEVRSEITENEMDLEVDMSLPRIFIEGYYRGVGIVNEIHLQSKGYFNVTASNIEGTWKIGGSLKEIEGENYMKINKFDSEPKIGEMKIYAEGLLPDPELNRIALEIVNQYWPIMYTEMIPAVKSTWEPVLIKLVDGVFDRVPFRRLLL